jgi:tripartite ATP-independent transporter DctM subunit
MPVALSLIVTALGFSFLAFGDMAPIQLYRFVERVAAQPLFAAIPLFIFMGAMLERSGIAERLFVAMRLWLGRLPGGLALATISMCAIFAAGTGIVGAVEVMVGMMTIPVMMRFGYDRGLIAGTICAGGSLGTMIPPSIVVVIYASQARLSIGDLFAGVMLPGILMVAFFLGYIVMRCWLRPQDGPPAELEDVAMPTGRKLWITATSVMPALLLVVAVVGSIMAGIAAPTEAAAVGALGTILLAIVYGRFRLPVLSEALSKSMVITAMVMLIVVGGTMFTSIFQIHGGKALVADTVNALGLTPTQTVFVLLGVVGLMGFVLDWVSVVLITVPIYEPLLRLAGVDPLWFGVMAIVVIQTSYLTPPMAPAIFYLKGVAPPEMTYWDMCRGVAPFVLGQLLVLACVFAFPGLATWLPEVFRG